VHGYTRFWAGYPKAEPAPLHDCEPLLECLLQYLDEGRRPILNCTPSGALELSRRAVRAGRSLRGVHFLLGAEPLSEARREGIVASGAVPIPTYGTSEGGWIGAQFPGAEHADEIAVFRDAYAVIPLPEDTSEESPPFSPILLTNLRPAAPKVLVNTGIGDSARISTYRPSEYAASLGYDLRLNHIRSFGKVTVFGSTFTLADLRILLEEILPRICGGGPSDYQLVETEEEEEEEGTARLILRVNPDVAGLHTDEIRRTFLRELEALQHFYGPMTRVLEQGPSLVIKRQKPTVGPTGKLSPVITQK
jgi:phenylacetate-coenzyme A ligase PaaK-like adenylate-forming protein